jgi:hypothetical protein
MKNYVLIGDIHSQYDQLNSALKFIQNNIKNYYIIFLGDLFDSRTNSSNSVDVYHKIQHLINCNKGVVLQSNHQNKHIRWMKGNSVYLNNGLDQTIKDFTDSDVDVKQLLQWLISFPYAIAFKDKYGLEYRCAHAYFSSKLFVPTKYDEEYLIYDVSNSTQKKCLYGIMENNERLEWWNQKSNHSWIRVAGHYHRVHIDLKTTKSIVLDGECGGEGGKLHIYDVNSKKSYLF